MVVTGHLLAGVQGGLREGTADGERGAGILAKNAGSDVAHADCPTGLVEGAGAGEGLRAET